MGLGRRKGILEWINLWLNKYTLFIVKGSTNFSSFLQIASLNKYWRGDLTRTIKKTKPTISQPKSGNKRQSMRFPTESVKDIIVSEHSALTAFEQSRGRNSFYCSSS
jgi:hypothetical protein